MEQYSRTLEAHRLSPPYYMFGTELFEGYQNGKPLVFPSIKSNCSDHDLVNTHYVSHIHFEEERRCPLLTGSTRLTARLLRRLKRRLWT